ncbi:MAG TPA: DUF1028 domain-containing protein [Thermomicrobiales bacterium]|nr:DUF1028 domain-containing protein [Thermomicrobiales bacterium]
MKSAQPVVNTFSIVARDPDTGDLGVAVQSKFLAVGAVVPWARAGVGAIATQAHANVSYGPDGLVMLETGLSAQEVLDKLTTADTGRDQRQAGIVDALGHVATFTGPGCTDWAGGFAGNGYCCQGNILTGPEVVDAMAEGYVTAQGSFAARLLTALEAGQAAGGDSRGQQSAAILVVRANGGYGGGNDRWIDLRVDDHPRPIAELRRLVMLHRVYFDIDDADLQPLDDALLAVVAGHLARLGRLDRADSSRAEIEAALAAWAGTENLEERLRSDGQIDSVVLELLAGG